MQPCSGYAPKRPTMVRTFAHPVDQVRMNLIDVIPPPSFQHPIRVLTKCVNIRNRDCKTLLIRVIGNPHAQQPYFYQIDPTLVKKNLRRRRGDLSVSGGRGHDESRLKMASEGSMPGCSRVVGKSGQARRGWVGVPAQPLFCLFRPMTASSSC